MGLRASRVFSGEARGWAGGCLDPMTCVLRVGDIRSRRCSDWIRGLGHTGFEDPVPSLFTFKYSDDHIVGWMGVSMPECAREGCGIETGR